MHIMPSSFRFVCLEEKQKGRDRKRREKLNKKVKIQNTKGKRNRGLGGKH